MAPPRIAVVGAGIVGAVATHALAQAGAAVTVLHRGPSLLQQGDSHSAAAPSDSFGWIHATEGLTCDPTSQVQTSMHMLRRLGMGAWPRLADSLRPLDVGLRWGGRLAWAPAGGAVRQGGTGPVLEAGAALASHARRLACLGYVGRHLDGPGLKGCEPAFVPPVGPSLLTNDSSPTASADPFAATSPRPTAVFFGDEGQVESELVVRACLTAACQLGATEVPDVDVTGVLDDRRGTVVLETTNGPVTPDMVLLTSRDSMPTFSESLGVHLPLDNRARGRIVRTPPLGRQLFAEPGRVLLVLAGVDHPGVAVRQAMDGSVLLQQELVSGTEELPAEGILEVAARFLPALADLDAELEDGVPQLPGDGRPVAGFLSPGVYTIFTDYDVTLSPLVSSY